jgi:amidase
VLNAAVRLRETDALRNAAAADTRRAGDEGHSAHVHGVPLTVKVNVDFTGFPNDNGVRGFRDAAASEDSPLSPICAAPAPSLSARPIRLHF